MKIFSYFQIAVMLFTFALTLTGYYLIDYLSEEEPIDAYKSFYFEGYDFQKMQSGDSDFQQFNPGETIELEGLYANDGDRNLAAYAKHLTLIVFLDPECPFTLRSSDIYSHLRTEIDPSTIHYAPVLMSSNTLTQKDATAYFASLGFTRGFIPNANKGITLGTFENIPTPAHILVNNDGIVLRVWFSSSNSSAVRMRMANQIANDIDFLLEVEEALRSASRLNITPKS